MLTDYWVSAATKEGAQDEGDDEDVVELTGDRNEIGYEVEGEGEVSGEREQKRFLSAWYTWVAEQAAAEKDAIGNEPGKRACTFVSSGDDEREDEEGVEKKEGGNRNEEPRPDAHACSLVLDYADQQAGRRLHELARAVGWDGGGWPRRPIRVSKWAAPTPTSARLRLLSDARACRQRPRGVLLHR